MASRVKALEGMRHTFPTNLATRLVMHLSYNPILIKVAIYDKVVKFSDATCVCVRAAAG